MHPTRLRYFTDNIFNLSERPCCDFLIVEAEHDSFSSALLQFAKIGKETDT